MWDQTAVCMTRTLEIIDCGVAEGKRKIGRWAEMTRDKMRWDEIDMYALRYWGGLDIDWLVESLID